MTIEEYLDFEGRSLVKHEYVAGRVYAFAGTSIRHNKIFTNVFEMLASPTREQGCWLFGSDARLRVEDDAVYYPDLMVVCDLDEAEDRYVTNPCLLIEILSRSTANRDRREKLLVYRGIPSLRGYLLVEQDKRKAELHWRDGAGNWQHIAAVGDGKLSLPCPETTVHLTSVYRGLQI
jgi:Uma2 family endonuclease